MTQSLHRCHCFSMTTNVIEIKYLLETQGMWEVVGLFIYFFGGQFKDQWFEGFF